MRMSALLLVPLVAGWFAILAGAPSHAAESQAQETETNSTSRIEISGRVVDSQGRPVAGATVMLIASVDTDLDWFGDFNPDRGLMCSQSDEAGYFTVGFDRSDSEFMVRGDRVLVVQLRGFQRYVAPLPVERMLSNAPLDVQLSKEEAVTIKVLSSNREALKSAIVALASQRGRRIPWCTLQSPITTVTDANGEVTLGGSSPASIQAVFVSHPAIGNQRVPVIQSEDGELVAHVSPSRSVAGKIESNDGSAIPGLDEIKLLVVSVPLEKYHPPHTPIECGWAFVPVTADGSFEIPQLQLGDVMYRIRCPSSFAWREPRTGETPSLEAGADADDAWPWRIEFQRQPRIFVTILNEAGEPLPNIHIANFDSRLRPTVTDGFGKASFFRTTIRSSYYPADATGQYDNPDSFFQYAEKPPVDDKVEFPPYRLVRSSQWTGQVVDEAGNGVGGAKVSYEFSQERFHVTHGAYSNVDGTFTLTDVSDGTAIHLRATTDRHASETKSILLPESDGLKLQLIEQPVASPAGQVVDLSGQPVAGVFVSIQRANVIIKEQYNRETVSPVPLYSPPEVARTDANGRFRFPQTQDFAQRLRIEVHDPRFFDLASPFIDAGKLARTTTKPDAPSLTDSIGEHDGQVADLGRFRIMRRPESHRVTLLIASTDGKAVPNAEAVLVGARIEKALGTSDASGRMELDAQSGPGVLAVRAARHHVYFGPFDGGYVTSDSEESHVHKVILKPDSDPVTPLRDSGSITTVDRREFVAAARNLLEAWEAPKPEATTYHRLRLYLDALAARSPDEFAQFVKVNAAKGPTLQAATAGARSALQRKPELINMATYSSTIEWEAETHLWLTAANAATDADQRTEWLGEAFISAREPFAKGRCTLAFLAAEEFELAKQVARDLWESSAELRDLVESETRQQKIGDARLIAPAIAIVDLESAWKLIELTASENEIGSLKTQSLLNWGMLHRDELLPRLSDVRFTETVSPAEFAGGIETWLRMMGAYDKLGFEGLPAPLELAEKIEDTKSRLEFLLFHARLTTDQRLRTQLIEQATAAIRETDPATADNIYSHYLQPLAAAESLLTSLPPPELDELIFAALHQLPPSFDGPQLHSILASAARVLACRNRQLARVLLEPAFADRGWMFSRSVAYDRNRVTEAVAHIDPSWSLAIVETLSNEEYRHDVADQLELRSGLIRELMNVQ